MARKSSVLMVDTFIAAIGTHFLVPFDNDRHVSLLLQAVRPLPIQEFPDRARDPFVLEFWCDGAIGMRAATYVLYHERLGELQLYLQPVTSGIGRYSAIFT